MNNLFSSVLSALLRPGWPTMPLLPAAPRPYTWITPKTEPSAEDDATLETELDDEGRPCGWDYAEHNTKIDRKDFGELLDHIDGTFKSARRQYDRLSWADQATIAGLKKMGIHIPYPWFVQNGQTEPLDPTKIPTLMSLSTSNAAHDKETKADTDVVHPECMFAQRLPRLPPGIELAKGTPYQFGIAYPFAKSGILFWITCWLVIKPNGMVHLCRELRRESYDIKSRRHQGTVRVPIERWNHPAMTLLDDKRLSQKDHEDFIKGLFYSMVRWWQLRDRRWSIIVTKDSQRVTFGIHKRMTADFFKDRQKTVITATGRTRKIFHYVQEHTRANGSFVRAHTRGQREFDWNGYHCKIMAPEFDGATAAAFTLAPVDEEAPLPGKRYLNAEDLGQFLGNHEATPITRPRTRRRRMAHRP